MTDFLVTGRSFSAGEQGITAADLNQMVNSATPQNLTRAHFDAVSKIITKGTTAPTTPVAGEIWYDTNTPAAYKGYDGTSWTAFNPRQEITLTAQSTIAIGDVVVIDEGTASSVQTTTSANAIGVVGIATTAGTTGNPVSVATQGAVALNVTGTTAIGDFLETSTTAGSADPQATQVAASFARALTADSGGSLTALIIPQALQGLTSPDDGAGGFGNTGNALTFDRGSGTMTQNTWYTFPGGTSSDVSAPTSEFRINFTTTRANQLVFIHISDMTAEITGGSFSNPEDFEIALITGEDDPVMTWTYESNGSAIFENGAASCTIRLEGICAPVIINTAATTYARLKWRNVGGNWSNTMSGTGTIRVLTDTPA